MFGLKNEEILTCFLLIVVGYCIAKMFSRSCNGFSVSADTCSQHGEPGSCFNNCKWQNGRCVSQSVPNLPPPPSSCRSSGEPCVNNVQCCLGSCSSRGKCM